MHLPATIRAFYLDNTVTKRWCVYYYS